jgi:hypothetical protein
MPTVLPFQIEFTQSLPFTDILWSSIYIFGEFIVLNEVGLDQLKEELFAVVQETIQLPFHYQVIVPRPSSPNSFSPRGS